MVPYTSLCNPILQFTLDILNGVLLRPLPNIIPITLQPRRLSTDSIQTLSQSLVETLSTSFLEEGLDAIDAFFAAEARCANRDHRSEHGQASWEAACELVPVLCHPDVECFDALGVRAKSTDWHVDVLFFHFTAEGESEGSFDKFGVLRSA